MVKTKIKPVLPSLRAKKRYLVFEIISEQAIKDVSLVSSTIINCTSKLLGDYGMAKANINILSNKWNEELQRCIVKVNHKYAEALRAALTLVDKINDQKVIIRSLGISGILRKAEKKYLIGEV